MYVLYDKYLNLNILKTKILYEQSLFTAMWYTFVAYV